jgi:tRNA nucleotidyltransferase (CCA-adding enzyme)
MNLMDAPSIKSAIDGKILQKALGAPAGTWMKPTLDVCMAWQLRNPEVTAADPEKARAEMIQLVREKKVELNIPI